jgi:hypothetical protein
VRVSGAPRAHAGPRGLSIPEPEAPPPEADQLRAGPGRRPATALVPVIGSRNPAQLEDYLDALDVHMDDEQCRRLDEASRIQLGQPHDLISSRRGPLLGGDAGAFESPVVPVT